jgi:hypothetical protein
MSWWKDIGSPVLSMSEKLDLQTWFCEQVSGGGSPGHRSDCPGLITRGYLPQGLLRGMVSLEGKGCFGTGVLKVMGTLGERGGFGSGFQKHLCFAVNTLWATTHYF